MLLAALVGAVALLAADITRFHWICLSQTALARQGRDRIDFPVSRDEAIVVLTGDHSRIPKAVDLLRHRQTPLLLISGTKKGVSLRELVNQQGDAAMNIHETWEKMVIESESASTIENAIESAKILTKRNFRRVILVTSDYHMHRSLLVFRRVAPAMEYVAYPVASEVGELTLAPTAKNLTALWKLWVEYWKLLAFRVMLSTGIGV